MGERLAMPGCRAEYAVSWGKEFLSTPSARRATFDTAQSGKVIRISIHALREEGDNPGFPQRLDVVEFLSTPSARRATKIFKAHHRDSSISIHALREEGDPVPLFWARPAIYFYPRPP